MKKKKINKKKYVAKNKKVTHTQTVLDMVMPIILGSVIGRSFFLGNVQQKEKEPDTVDADYEVIEPKRLPDSK